MSEVHAAIIAVAEPAPAEVAVGADFALKVKLTCSAGCDLRTVRLAVTAPGGALSTCEASAASADGSGDGLELALKAPNEVGTQVWQLAFSPDDIAGVSHAGEPLSVSATVKPHHHEPCGLEHSVAGRDGAAVRDQSRREIVRQPRTGGPHDRRSATRTARRSRRRELGETAWPGTDGLYWTDVELPAPGSEGHWSWSVRFVATELDLPHEGTSAGFNLTDRAAARTQLTVKVVAKETS